jgi:acyl CoA:acetate/3-ketoacid CoA transferase beta subunit
MILVELQPGASLDEVQAKTEAAFIVSPHLNNGYLKEGF